MFTIECEVVDSIWGRSTPISIKYLYAVWSLILTKPHADQINGPIFLEKLPNDRCIPVLLMNYAQLLAYTQLTSLTSTCSTIFSLQLFGWGVEPISESLIPGLKLFDEYIIFTSDESPFILVHLRLVFLDLQAWEEENLVLMRYDSPCTYYML